MIVKIENNWHKFKTNSIKFSFHNDALLGYQMIKITKKNNVILKCFQLFYLQLPSLIQTKIFFFSFCIFIKIFFLHAFFFSCFIANSSIPRQYFLQPSKIYFCAINDSTFLWLFNGIYFKRKRFPEYSSRCVWSYYHRSGRLCLWLSRLFYL